MLDWYPDTPHSDDIERLNAIKENLVGQNCKMGGAAIRLFAESGRPCDFCPMVEREECGGTPKEHVDSHHQKLDADPERDYNQNTTADAFRTERQRYRRMLDLAFRKKEENET